MRIITTLFVLVALTGPAAAQDDCLKQTLPSYELDREKGETPRAVGERFLADIGKHSPGVVANVKDAVRYELQQEVADSFARNQKFVLWAYGIAWLVPLGFAVYVWMRHRKVAADLADLERRLGGGR